MFNHLEQQQIINTKVQKSERIIYKADFLKSIECKVDHEQRYRLLHPNICGTVRITRIKQEENKKEKQSSSISKFQQSCYNKMYSKEIHLQHVY